MVTSQQVRAGRALLGWTQELLADKAVVALTASKRLEAAGILLLSSGREEGVMLVRRETKNRREKFVRLRKTVEGRRH
jgi:hypothetical protein